MKVLVAELDKAHPDDRKRAERISSQMLVDGHPAEFEWRLVRPDGEVRHIFSRHVAVRSGAGAIVRLAGTCIDITERKFAEQNQQTLLRELQSAIAEVRTLQGMIRICANCKRVLTDEGGWEQFESYARSHSNVEFSHGICPECARQWGSVTEVP